MSGDLSTDVRFFSCVFHPGGGGGGDSHMKGAGMLVGSFELNP